MAEFVQIMRFKTDLDVEQLRKMNEEYRAATSDRGTYSGAVVGRDLDSGEYVVVVTFPSKEAADANNELPETKANAEEMGRHATNLTFSNIEVIDRS